MCLKILRVYSTNIMPGKFVIAEFDSIAWSTVTSANNTVSEIFFMVSGEMLRVQTYQKIKSGLLGAYINYNDKHFQNIYVMINTVLGILNQLSDTFLSLKIYLTKILKLRLRKVKSFIQGHTAIKWQSQDSYPGLLVSNAQALSIKSNIHLLSSTSACQHAF